MKKLLVTLLAGLGMITLVGCGTTENVDIKDNNNNATIEESIEDKSMDEGTNAALDLIQIIADAVSEFKNLSEEELDHLTASENNLLEAVEPVAEKYAEKFYERTISSLKTQGRNKEYKEYKANKEAKVESYKDDIILAICESIMNQADKQEKAEAYPESRPNIEESKPVEKQTPAKEEVKKESEELVQLIKDSEKYTWLLHEAINSGTQDLNPSISLCQDIIQRSMLITVDDCEFEGELVSVQIMQEGYIQLKNAFEICMADGIDPATSSDVVNSYNKLNKETSFLMNELNN